MFGYIMAEWKKTRKFQFFLIGLLFLSLTSFIGLFTYYYYHNSLVEGTLTRVLWGQLTFYYSSLLYPPLLAILVGMIWVPEFENKSLEMLKANHISLGKLLLGKIVSLLVILFPVQLILILVYIVVAYLDGILIWGDVLMRLKWVILSILGSLPLIAIQTYLTVKSHSFSKAIGLATIGGIATFAFIFLDSSLNQFYPYAQPMLALRSREMSDLSVLDFSSLELLVFLLVNVLFTILFIFLSHRTLRREAKKGRI